MRLYCLLKGCDYFVSQVLVSLFFKAEIHSLIVSSELRWPRQVNSFDGIDEPEILLPLVANYQEFYVKVSGYWSQNSRQMGYEILKMHSLQRTQDFLVVDVRRWWEKNRGAWRTSTHLEYLIISNLMELRGNVHAKHKIWMVVEGRTMSFFVQGQKSRNGTWSWEDHHLSFVRN